MSRLHLTIAFAILLILAAAGLWAEAEILYYGSSGLATDGLKGYIGEKHPQERIVVRADEAPVYLLFFWDNEDLALQASIVDAGGTQIALLDLSKGNTITFSAKGEYVCTLSAKSGSGHWFCAILGSREWTP